MVSRYVELGGLRESESYFRDETDPMEQAGSSECGVQNSGSQIPHSLFYFLGRIAVQVGDLRRPGLRPGELCLYPGGEEHPGCPIGKSDPPRSLTLK